METMSCISRVLIYTITMYKAIFRDASIIMRSVLHWSSDEMMETLTQHFKRIVRKLDLSP